MYKIKNITFVEHPILGNLSLDFCDKNGNAVDTIILAGENGTGKSTILSELYNIASINVKYPCVVCFDVDGHDVWIEYSMHKSPISFNEYMIANDNVGYNSTANSESFKSIYNFSGIYSDVDINFKSNVLSSVTSLALDTTSESRKSTSDLPTKINQLLIDIQASDDADIAQKVKENPTIPYENLNIEERMSRFSNAFNKMFEHLSYSKIVNSNGKKSIIFEKYGIPISIDSLSSGEKQIVYRGSFLLKDVNAMNGTFVFIDEPEISLHPNWQKKVMLFYKDIFTNDSGIQTSQIFSVTHSPFIVHNEYRKNDKVIVLSRDEFGNIISLDNPAYFKCDSVKVVEDAFSIHNFAVDDSFVYLEGRTDEKYFNRALEVFNLDVPFKFKWIGYCGDNGQEEFTGKDALNKAVHFLISNKFEKKNVCLFDCDTQRVEQEKNNVFVRVVDTYENSKSMKKGIENALVLDNVDITEFYCSKIKEGDYGDNNTIVEFKKMEFCDYICSLDNESLQDILINLKVEIEKLLDLF